MKKKHPHKKQSSEEVKELKRIERVERKELHELEEIEKVLKPKKAKSATATIIPNKRKGARPMSIKVGGNGAKFVFKEWDGPNGTGNEVAPIGAVNYSVDDTSVATIDQSGNITAVAAGNYIATATDSGNSLMASASDTVEGSGLAVSATGTIVNN